MTRLPSAFSASIWSTAAANTLALSSARSGAKLRPGFEPQSTTRPRAPSGCAKGVVRTTRRAAEALLPFRFRKIKLVRLQRLIVGALAGSGS